MNVQTQYSTDSSPSRMSAAYATDVPTFLKRTKEKGGCRKPNENLLKTTMLSAIERYEKSLANLNKKTLNNTTDCIEDMTKLNELESNKRRVNIKNTHEYVCAQIKERVCAVDYIAK